MIDEHGWGYYDFQTHSDINVFKLHIKKKIDSVEGYPSSCMSKPHTN